VILGRSPRLLIERLSGPTARHGFWADRVAPALLTLAAGLAVRFAFLGRWLLPLRSWLLPD
jgi:hypothetical protein